MDVPEAERPEAARAELRKRLGVRTFKAAPEGFDPLSASPRALRAHGYPARPDAKAHPRLHDQWVEVMSEPWRMIEPQFEVMDDKAHGPRHDYGLPAGNGWGGAIAFTKKDDTVTWVSGQWTVPHISPPTSGHCIVANWIGIDGANGDPNGNDSYDILQTGTTQLIVNGLIQAYLSYVWFEWYPAPPVTISNLHVSAGDTMYAVICVYSPTEAGIHLLNRTTGLGTAFIKTSKKVQLVGNCAEWVIEDPTGANMVLGRFGDTYFDECVAGTQNGQLLTAGGAKVLKMYDVNGKTIAQPSIETDLLVRIRYTDAAP